MRLGEVEGKPREVTERAGKGPEHQGSPHSFHTSPE
jgi:hypothetical protein